MGNPELGSLTTTTMTNRSRGFYTTMGPYLSRRAIAAEIGGPIWDDDDKTWWVVKDGSRVVGFAAAIEEPSGTVALKSAWVHPDYRRCGIHTDLIGQRLDAYPGCPVRAVCTAAAWPQLQAHGFVVVRDKGAFREVRRGR